MRQINILSALAIACLGLMSGPSWTMQLQSHLSIITGKKHLIDGEHAPSTNERPDDVSLWKDSRLYADLIAHWNGDIFWAPASVSTNVITRFGDEARAVFGPIPEANCAKGVSIPIEVDGNIIDLRPNHNKLGQPLEFAHLDIGGRIVKWTEAIPRCDKPSLAGGDVTYCGMSSRLSRVEQGSVEWLFLCRKSSDSKKVEADPYWSKSNPKFRLFGTIGFNHATGEIVFFDGRKDRTEFDWSTPLPAPGGRSYGDRAGREAAEALYDPTFQVQCSSCHDNKNPYVITPHILQSRVGYFGGEEDPRAAAFSLGDFLPETSRLEGAPFRVIGSGYTARYRIFLGQAKTVRDPNGKCTTCHTLTTQITGRRFAADAIARWPRASKANGAQASELVGEQIAYAEIERHRTDWALSSGQGKIHPWMVPEHGNRLAEQPYEQLSEEEWHKLSDCLWGDGGSECSYKPLYTQCLPPQAIEGGDGSTPIDLELSVLPQNSQEVGADRALELRWRYLNSYGDVPTRDDVRFDVVVREAKVAPNGIAPVPAEYPSIPDVTAENQLPADIEVSGSASAVIIRNVSHLGHDKWTDPTAAYAPREYKISLPATCNRRYLVRLLPKRYCFDQSYIVYSEADHLRYVDVKCS